MKTPSTTPSTTPKLTTPKADHFVFSVNCPYKDSCKSRGIRCNSCEHNQDKEDYYQPRRPIPLYPWKYEPHCRPNPPLRPKYTCRCMQ